MVLGAEEAAWEWAGGGGGEERIEKWKIEDSGGGGSRIKVVVVAVVCLAAYIPHLRPYSFGDRKVSGAGQHSAFTIR